MSKRIRKELSAMLRRRCLQSVENLLNPERIYGDQIPLYHYIDNGASVLGVAHVDHVDCGLGEHWAQRGPIVRSTRLDDRLGVHVLLDILPRMGIEVDVLLTNDEEIGRSTAQHFDPPKPYNWMFSFDRRGRDAVVYDYEPMEAYLTDHFTIGQGSFSDICYLDHLGCSGVNIGTGYYHEHTPQSYADLRHTYAQVRAFGAFWERYRDTFIPAEHPSSKRKRGKAATWPPHYRELDYIGRNMTEHDWDQLDQIVQQLGYRDLNDFAYSEGLSVFEALEELEMFL